MRCSPLWRVFAIGICLLLVASGVPAYRSLAADPTFTDVDPQSNSPYAIAIYELAKRGIVRGYNDGSGRFGPLDPVRRAQAAAIVARALGWANEQGQANFSDQGAVDSELWNNVRVLADRRVARGYEDGTYRPMDNVAQVQIVSLISRAAVSAGFWQQQADNGSYPDVPAASGARADVVTYAHYVGVIPFASGTGPGGWSTWADDANRQEVALVVWGAMRQWGGKPPPSTSPAPSASPTPSTEPGGPAPVAGQPCPSWVHDRYRAPGPDGKLYATWHPPTDPQYGCTFGHEHGVDPNGAPALRGRTVIFDYVNGLAGRSEAHVGFKIFRWDNVQHPNSPSHNGAQVVMMIHQGSSTDNAFMETRHEIAVHYYNPNDGRELHVNMLAPFGALGIGCGANDPALFKVQQANTPGMRQIPGEKCFGAALNNAPGTVPGSIPYEDWITALYIGTDAQGNNPKAYFDPHFAIFNPNRYCIIQNNACVLGRSDTRAQTGIDPYSTQSSYKGAKREAYLNQAWITNQGGSTAVWTDVDGRLVAPNSPGAIQQYVASINARPQVNSSAFGADDATDDGTVHAPN